MANLERTAYPRFPRVITTRDLLRHYTPDVDEVEWASGFARSDTGRLGLIVLLKTFQQLHYFPALENVPAEIISHIRTVRSEEHTSELQSLMRNSYAVFCLKKQT